MTESEIRSMIGTSRKEGFRLLFEEYHAYVYHIVWNTIRSVGSKEDAEECVSDIFTELYLHFDDVEEGSLKGYLSVMARRRSVNLFHALTRKEPMLSLDEEEASEPASAENIVVDTERKQEQQLLLDAVESLGEPDASIILYKYFYGLNAAEIARKVHLNPINVRVRLNRALKKLRSLLSGTFMDRR